MYPAILTPSNRTRSTPFTKRVNAAGVKGYTVYNHMLLPTFFESVVADYHHLKNHVQVWDVSCERQVEITGPDAARLVQLLTPRNLAKLKVGQCYYIPVVDEFGGMLNDPVALKLAEDRFWISLADSDLLLWIKGYACGRGFDVTVTEPDVSPLAVQGPKSDQLMALVFGDDVERTGFFRFKHLPFQDTTFVVARSGYSRQGGFEIYVQNGTCGEAIWDALFEAGEDLQVRAGCPNLIERIEGGLLSYGNDMTRENTLYECGLGKFSQPDLVADCIGREVLLAQQAEEPRRQIRGLRIDGEGVPPCTEPWPLIGGKTKAGKVTSAAWSPDFNSNLAIGMVDNGHWNPDTRLVVQTPVGDRTATVCTIPFST